VRDAINRAFPAGPLVKVEAITEWGALVRVEMPQERFRSLHLLRDETVFLIPRDVRVFEKGRTA